MYDRHPRDVDRQTMSQNEFEASFDQQECRLCGAPFNLGAQNYYDRLCPSCWNETNNDGVKGTPLVAESNERLIGDTISKNTIMVTTRDPPNQRMADRENELNQITRNTVHAAYHGGGVFVLTSRDGDFWTDTYRALEEYDYAINKSIDGTLYVEKRHK
jgi:hypothetical protein